MKRKTILTVSLLIIVSLMIALSSAAIDMFSASRNSSIAVVNDSNAFIALCSN